MNTIRRALPCGALALALIFTACHQKKSGTGAAPAQTIPQVTDYSYIVSVFRSNVSWSPDNEQWRPVAQGQVIGRGAYVETGLASAATLAGSLGDIVMMGERAKARLLVEELEKHTGASLAVRGVTLLKGVARFAVAKHQGGFVVETPSAFVRVKGTEFAVAYDEKNGTTDVVVREGEVDVQDKNVTQKSYPVDKGHALTGVGTPAPVQRVMTSADSAVFNGMEAAAGAGLEPVRSSENPAARAAEARQRLEKTMSAAGSSRKTDSARTASQAVLENERAAAQAKILSAGLTVGVVSQLPSADVPAGEVVSQTPKAGDEVDAGSSVDIVISVGSSSPTPTPSDSVFPM